MKTYIFKTLLQRDNKLIREIEVCGNISLYKLAEIIINAYGFDFDHCFGFFGNVKNDDIYHAPVKYELFADLEDEGIEPVDSGSVKKTKIDKVWKKIGDKMVFMFDYGDDWRWLVELKGFGEKDSKKKYPRVLLKQGRAPRQY